MVWELKSMRIMKKKTLKLGVWGRIYNEVVIKR